MSAAAVPFAPGVAACPRRSADSVTRVCVRRRLRSQLSRAFRMRSLRVHPDKNPAPEAREAFDALNATQRLLLDASKRVRLLLAAADTSEKSRLTRARV